MAGPDLIPAWVGDRLTPVDKIEVHRRALRHPAVSVFVMVDAPEGPEWLVQRRALTKYHTPGLWANSCCTHPHWGEAPDACALRRLREELGFRLDRLEPAGRIDYRADVGGGMVEHEAVDLFVARLAARPVLAPDPAEVAAVRWATPAALLAEIAAEPARFTPWFRIYMRDHLSRVTG